MYRFANNNHYLTATEPHPVDCWHIIHLPLIAAHFYFKTQNQPHMKHVLLVAGIIGLILACNNEKEKTTDAATAPAATTTPTDLPYKASYSSSWDRNVSDDDLKLVLLSYKHWADGNMDALMNTMGDTAWVDHSDGVSKNYSNAELRSFWSKSRDSLRSVTIDMQAWERMRSTDKNDSFVVTWYKQVDVYKDGRVDSAQYHDINQVKGGKIVWYSQYRRALK